MPRAASESATANGMAPPPAITPTGEEISEAAVIMVAAVPSSRFYARVGGPGPNTAAHHRRSDRGELVHRRQPADEDEIADLAMAAERRRRREDHVIADLAVVPDMAAIHEVAAGADPGDAAAGHGAGVHRDGFA